MRPYAAVQLVPHLEQWRQLFEAERTRLTRIFPSATIEHIGSTSVPGLAAKPIVDIMIGANSIAEVENGMDAMIGIGYRYFARSEYRFPGRRFFAKYVWGVRLFHVHAVILNSSFWFEHLAFRDALRSDRQLAFACQRLKEGLALEHSHDRNVYTAAKGPFINSIVAQQLRPSTITAISCFETKPGRQPPAPEVAVTSPP